MQGFKAACLHLASTTCLSRGGTSRHSGPGTLAWPRCTDIANYARPWACGQCRWQGHAPMMLSSFERRSDMCQCSCNPQSMCTTPVDRGSGCRSGPEGVDTCQTMICAKILQCSPQEAASRIETAVLCNMWYFSIVALFLSLLPLHLWLRVSELCICPGPLPCHVLTCLPCCVMSWLCCG